MTDLEDLGCISDEDGINGKIIPISSHLIAATDTGRIAAADNEDQPCIYILRLVFCAVGKQPTRCQGEKPPQMHNRNEGGRLTR